MPTPDRTKKTREQIIAAIKAKRASRKTITRPSKFARLRVVARFKSADVSEALEELVDNFEGLAEDLDALTENLDLIPEGESEDSKTASKRSRKFAAGFRRLAEEDPGAFQEALQDVYTRLDDITEGIENLAENTGVTLEDPKLEDKSEEATSSPEDES
jgi:uncharacterized protein (DUF58 family)